MQKSGGCRISFSFQTEGGHFSFARSGHLIANRMEIAPVAALPKREWGINLNRLGKVGYSAFISEEIGGINEMNFEFISQAPAL